MYGRYVRAEGKQKQGIQDQIGMEMGRGCGRCFGLRGSKEAVNGCKWTSTEGDGELHDCGTGNPIQQQQTPSCNTEQGGAKGRKVSCVFFPCSFPFVQDVVPTVGDFWPLPRVRMRPLANGGSIDISGQEDHADEPKRYTYFGVYLLL